MRFPVTLPFWRSHYEEKAVYSRTFIGKMIMRKWTIEGLFAETKQFHGLRRARYRGLQKVSIQALMAAMAQNIKRIVNQTSNIRWFFNLDLSIQEQMLRVQIYLDRVRCNLSVTQCAHVCG
jgi:hypothetical protein